MRNSKEYDFYFVMAPITIKYPSGGTNVIYELAKRLKQSGYRVAIHFVGNPWKTAKKYFPDREIKEWSSVGTFLKSILNNRISFRLVIPLIRRFLRIRYSEELEGVDLFFSGAISKTSLIKRMIATDYITAFFVDSQGGTFKKFFFSQLDESDSNYLSKLSWMAEKTYSLALELIVINLGMLEKFKERKPLLLHIGISDIFFQDEFDIVKSERDKPSVLIPLRTGKMKGATYGIGAAKLLHSEFPEISIKAFGNYPPEKVPEFIEYHERPSNTVLVNLYRKASIFVLPSLIEGMPAPPLEAMANSCAVVSSDCKGIHSYLVNEVNGLIVNRCDSDALFRAVIRLVKDKLLMKTLAYEGFQTAKNYSYDTMVSNFLSIMNST